LSADVGKMAVHCLRVTSTLTSFVSLEFESKEVPTF